MKYLGEFEERVLLGVIALQGNAYGVTVKQFLERETGHTVSYGALYTTLDRLEKKRFLSSRQGGASATRGGRAKRYFKIEALGSKVLKESHAARRKLHRLARLGPAPVY
jgi:DNA-binding PadR family transcriptional regulator